MVDFILKMITVYVESPSHKNYRRYNSSKLTEIDRNVPNMLAQRNTNDFNKQCIQLIKLNYSLSAVFNKFNKYKTKPLGGSGIKNDVIIDNFVCLHYLQAEVK